MSDCIHDPDVVMDGMRCPRCGNSPGVFHALGCTEALRIREARRKHNEKFPPLQANACDGRCRMETDRDLARLLAPDPDPTDPQALSYALFAPDPDDVAAAVQAEDMPGIIRDAGGDRLRELRLVNEQLRVIGWVERRAGNFIGVAAEELDRLNAYIARWEASRDRVTAYLKRRVEDWRRERGDPSSNNRTYDLPEGTVGLRRTRGTTKLVEQAIVAYAVAQADEGDPSLVEEVLERKWVVRPKAVRERFEMSANGSVVDRRTGAVVEPQTYYGEDGTVLSGPLMVQVEPPGDKFVLTLRTAKQLKEATTTDGTE